MSRESFERALKVRREIDEAAANGDEYAKVLKKGYDECNLAVLGMRWPRDSGEQDGRSLTVATRADGPFSASA